MEVGNLGDRKPEQWSILETKGGEGLHGKEERACVVEGLI